MNLTYEWELIEHEPIRTAENGDLSQTQNLALRLLRAGEGGLLTAELFRGLHCAKYTSRISDLRRQGHQIAAAKEHYLANALPTEQWRYHYEGFKGEAESLHPILARALREWKTTTGAQSKGRL